MENEKICSCFGHTDVDCNCFLRASTAREIDKLIENGVRTFLFGGRSDFDDLCYDIVSEKRAAAPELGIKRVFCFPLYRDLRKPPVWFRDREYEAKECPEKAFDYWYKSIYYRNCAMIDKSDFVLFYVEKRENSGAYKAFLHALRKHKPLVNLFDEMQE